jgi:hypothetical protein
MRGRLCCERVFLRLGGFANGHRASGSIATEYNFLGQLKPYRTDKHDRTHVLRAHVLRTVQFKLRDLLVASQIDIVECRAYFGGPETPRWRNW